MAGATGLIEPPGVAPPGVGQLALGLTVGSVALLMLGLQPLLLGALTVEGRLSVDELGLSATAELLMLGLTTGLLASLCKPVRLRAINVGACVALALANFMGMATSGFGFVASRALAGMASGVLVWIAVVMITRARSPDRAAGVFLTVQTLAQAGLAAVLPWSAMVRWGANGGLAVLALLALTASSASLAMADRFSPLPKPETAKRGLPRAGIGGLLSVFLYLAGVVGLWVFAARLGDATGQGEALTGFALAAALAAQVTGSSVAIFLSGRLPTMPVLALCAAGNIGVLWLLDAAPYPVPYWAAVLVFGFLWLFAMPFQTRLVIELDPSRRTAMLLSAAQLLGSAVGPLITSGFASQTSLRGALEADGVLFGFALVVTVAVGRRKKGLLF